MNRILRVAVLTVALLLLASLALPVALGVGEVVVYPDRTHASVGETVTWCVQLMGWTDPVCAYFLYRDGALIDYKPRSVDTYYQCTPDAPGTYSLKLFAGDNTGHFMWDGGSVQVDGGTARILFVAASRPRVELGTPISWTIATEGGAGMLHYGGKVYWDGKAIDKIEWKSGGNVLTYAPISPGTYSLAPAVDDGDQFIVGDPYSDPTAPVIVSTEKAAPLSISSVQPDRWETRVNEPITWTATAEGGTGDISFCFYLVKDGITVAEVPLGPSCVYRAVPKEEGVYCVVACAASGDETANLVSPEVNVRAPVGISIDSISCARTIAVLGKENIPWEVAVKNAVGEVRYTYTIYLNGALLGLGWDTANPFIDFIPTETGEYRLEAIAQDDLRTTSMISEPVNVVDSNLAVDSITADQLMGRVGAPVTWTVNESGAGGDLHFVYGVYRGGEPYSWAMTSDTDTFTFTPDKGGSKSYTLLVQVTDGIRMVTAESAPLTVVKAGAPRILSLEPDRVFCTVGTPVHWTVELENVPDPGEIAYELHGAASGTVAKGTFTDLLMFKFTPTAEDTYALRATLASDPTGTDVSGTPVKVMVDSTTQLYAAPIEGSLPSITEAPITAVAPAIIAAPIETATSVPELLTPVLPMVSLEVVTPRPTATKRPTRVQKTPAPTATSALFFQPPVLQIP